MKKQDSFKRISVCRDCPNLRSLRSPRDMLLWTSSQIISGKRGSTAVRAIAAATLMLFFLCPSSDLEGKQLKVVAQKQISGSIVSIRPGEITIKPKDGATQSFKIQDKDERAISIGGKPVRAPAKILVSGRIPVRLAEKGMIVQFLGRTNVYGKSDGELSELNVLSDTEAPELNVEFLERPEKREPGQVEVVGRVVNASTKSVILQVPKAKWAKKERITFSISESSVLLISDDHLNRVAPGDYARQANVIEFENGEFAINFIHVALNPDREQITTSYHERLAQRFSLLSDEPAQPREIRSDHFVLYTDVSDRDGQILLAKLETMFELVSGYYSARPNQVIECYVVKDLSKWPAGQLSPQGIAKIAERAGVTLTVSNGRSTQATVFACDKHAVVQHEAVHAFCAQTFGNLGPVWYAEGMAEMGQYWIPGELAVNIDPVVIDYLSNAKPKKMADIVAAGQITGDSWQAYAWRWALCHLLANNRNYSRRFKKLGLNIMTGKPDSFDDAFGRLADKISFEYDLFVKDFANGYRADLCAWDWNVTCSNLTSGSKIKQMVKAQRGWRATKLLVKEGVSYDFAGQGNWKVNADEEVSADGNSSGVGRLVGMIFYGDNQQSPAFELGARGSFVGSQEGQLYIRCRDKWTELADNEGEIELHIRRTPK